MACLQKAKVKGERFKTDEIKIVEKTENTERKNKNREI